MGKKKLRTMSQKLQNETGEMDRRAAKTQRKKATGKRLKLKVNSDFMKQLMTKMGHKPI